MDLQREIPTEEILAEQMVQELEPARSATVGDVVAGVTEAAGLAVEGVGRAAAETAGEVAVEGISKVAEGVGNAVAEGIGSVIGSLFDGL